MQRWRGLIALGLVLGLALAVRLALWDQIPRQGFISDEAEYLAAADWLAHGRGFAWYHGWLWTRAPLYPLFLAAHMVLCGFDLVPIYRSQIGLSVLNVLLVAVLAWLVVQHETRAPQPALRGVPILAALLAAIYFPFAMYPQIILSETLYLSLLLAAFAALGSYSLFATHRLRWLALLLGSLLLGLATLTRGLTLGMLPLVLLWLLWLHWRRWRTALLAVGLCGVVAGGTILPWSLYASRIYGGTILIDSTGAFNLLLGARTAYDGGRSDAPTRNFVLALLNPRLSQNERADLLAESCLLQRDDPRLLAALAQPAASITHAQRQQLMTAEGLCLLQAAPAAFIAKSAAELVDLFQINYTGAERMSSGFTQGRLPVWYALALFLADDTLYILLLVLSVAGWGAWWVHQQQPPLTTLIGLWWLYNLVTAPLLFAINRFRIPLLPLACIYAALLLVLLWQRARLPAPLVRVPRAALLLALLLVLIASTPYAYVQAAPATLASYLGPYPSSLVNTRLALRQRATYLHEQQITAALGRGDHATARRLIAQQPGPDLTRTVAVPLLYGLEGDPQAGLARLPDTATISHTRDWRASVVRGDLLRRMGDAEGARAAFTPSFVDDENPVAWAWQWLYPPATSRIDLGGNLDLGYISGFYLGEGDPSAGGTFRWATDGARVLLPQQGGAAQTVCMRVDGRGLPADLPTPNLTLAYAAGSDARYAPPTTFAPFATLPLSREIAELCARLPATPAGADLVLELRTTAFTPAAADLLAQQGSQAGQLRRLGVRLDWIELRPQ